VVRRFVKPVTDVECDRGRSGHLDGRRGGHRGPEAGLPVLAGAVAWLDCQVRQHLDLGSHLLFIAAVTATEGPDGDMPPVLRMEGHPE